MKLSQYRTKPKKEDFISNQRLSPKESRGSSAGSQTATVPARYGEQNFRMRQPLTHHDNNAQTTTSSHVSRASDQGSHTSNELIHHQIAQSHNPEYVLGNHENHHPPKNGQISSNSGHQSKHNNQQHSERVPVFHPSNVSPTAVGNDSPLISKSKNTKATSNTDNNSVSNFPSNLHQMIAVDEMRDKVRDELLVDKEATIMEMRETMSILETKIRKLEQLVRIKDAKIQTMTSKLKTAGIE